MNKAETIAWEMLTPDERTALTLSLGHSKSTWQAGEIMQKSHYKYLEISMRGEKFLKLFKNHLDNYNSIIPSNINLNPQFSDFIHFTIEKRKSMKSIPQLVDNAAYYRKYERDQVIISEMDKLDKGNQAQKDLFNLIHEFDRWNNFRILPQAIQMPSPFKRRNKARFKKHLKNLNSLPQQSLDILIEQLEYRGKNKKCFLVLLTPEDKDNNYLIIPMMDKPKYLEVINKVGLFAFREKHEAEDFAELIVGYLGIGRKSCIDGQKFWPKFREKIRRAYNYNAVENIVPSKKYLSMAFVSDDGLKIKKAEERRKQKLKKSK